MILFTKFAANAHDVRCMPADVCIIHVIHVHVHYSRFLLRVWHFLTEASHVPFSVSAPHTEAYLPV